MARLLHVTAEALALAQPGFAPPPGAAEGTRAQPPRPRGGPWFEVTPFAPVYDSRIGATDAAGVAAWLETFGGVSGPSTQRLREHVEGGAAVLGGTMAPPGTLVPERLDALRRDAALRLSLQATVPEGGRQILVLLSLVACGPIVLQLSLGPRPLGHLTMHAETRAAVLVDVPSDGLVAVDLRARACSLDPEALLAVLGAVGHLL